MLAKRPFEIIHIDTFSFEGHKFLTLIDLLSRYAQAYFITGITVLDKLRHFFSHHNYPAKIVCDEGKEFKNKVLQEYCKLFKIDLHFTTNYNSSSNSPIERVHSTILENLRIAKSQVKNETPQNLMISAVLIYNQSIHFSTGYAPFTLLYGAYDNLNAHEIDFTQTVYENYNAKRKEELLPLYEQIYHKQLDKSTRILDKQNQDETDTVEIQEPVA